MNSSPSKLFSGMFSTSTTAAAITIGAGGVSSSASSAVTVIAGRNFMILKQLGEGAQGFVYLIREVGSAASAPGAGISAMAGQSGAEYVLKKSSISAASPELLKIARNEARLMKTLSHPNIVTYICDAVDHSITSNGEVYDVSLVMEACLGGHLLDFVNKRALSGNPINEQTIMSLFAQACRAVDYLHSLNPAIAHRDIKLENLLLTSNGIVKLCDFGSCTTEKTTCSDKIIRAKMEEEIEKFTTPNYRAPEMIDLFSGYEINEQVDVWALGCALFAMCYRKHAFDDGSRLGILNCTYHVPQQPSYSQNLKIIFQWIFTKNPKKRPRVGDVLDYVESLLGIEVINSAKIRGTGSGARPGSVADPVANGDEDRQETRNSSGNSSNAADDQSSAGAKGGLKALREKRNAETKRPGEIRDVATTTVTTSNNKNSNNHANRSENVATNQKTAKENSNAGIDGFFTPFDPFSTFEAFPTPMPSQPSNHSSSSTTTTSSSSSWDIFGFGGSPYDAPSQTATASKNANVPPSPDMFSGIDPFSSFQTVMPQRSNNSTPHLPPMQPSPQIALQYQQTMPLNQVPMQPMKPQQYPPQYQQQQQHLHSQQMYMQQPTMNMYQQSQPGMMMPSTHQQQIMQPMMQQQQQQQQPSSTFQRSASFTQSSNQYYPNQMQQQQLQQQQQMNYQQQQQFQPSLNPIFYSNPGLSSGSFSGFPLPIGSTPNANGSAVAVAGGNGYNVGASGTVPSSSLSTASSSTSSSATQSIPISQQPQFFSTPGTFRL